MLPRETVPSVDLPGVRRALAIRHRAGGDLLLSTPALRALRAGLPAASIEVLTARGMGELLLGNPDVDRILEFDRRSLGSQAALYARLLRGGYDLVLDMVSTPRSAWLTALTRAPIRVGYDLPRRRYAYTHRLPRDVVGAEGPVPRYAAEGPLDLVRALGIDARGLALNFKVSAPAERRMGEWLAQSGIGARRPLIACLPAGSWPSKTWLKARFIEAMDRLSEAGDILWIWGPGEGRLAEACRAEMRAPSWLAPKTGWQDLGALLARASLLVSNDSGPKHLAAALGVPTVTIFGPTHPATWHPPGGPHTAVSADGLACLHCNETVCPLPGDANMRCMRDVTVERVIPSCRAWLRETGERTP